MSDEQELCCREVLERLDDYLDQALNEEELEQVEQHLERCRHCCDEHELNLGIVRALKAKLRRIRAPGTLKDRVGKLLASYVEAGGQCNEDPMAPEDPSGGA